MDPGRESEWRIDPVAGPYVAQFRLPQGLPAPASDLPGAPQTHGAQAATLARETFLRPRLLLIVMVAILVLGAGSLLACRFSGPGTATEKFWNPFLKSAKPALLCFGGGDQSNPTSAENMALTISEFEHLPCRRMHTLDAIALADIAGLLQANRKPYHIVSQASSTSFRDLQSGLFVLSGGMNNESTLRLTSGLRFSFEHQPNGARVRDQQNPSNTSWSVDITTPMSQFNRDYAIVSRVRDPKTEQTVIIAAGIGSWGTLAAGEFVARPEYLQKLDKLGPAHWEQKNLQAVLATDVIRGSSGPPILLAAQFW